MTTEYTLLEKLANPDLIHTLTVGEKLQGSLMVTALGMGITFASLILIRYLTSLLSYMVAKIENKGKPAVNVVETPKAAPVVEAVVEEEDDEELIAVISAAVAASLNTSIHNIIVRNIVRVNDETPAWGQAGRLEQLNSVIK